MATALINTLGEFCLTIRSAGNSGTFSFRFTDIETLCEYHFAQSSNHI